MNYKERIFTGGLKEFVLLFFPIALVNFSNYIFLFLEKLLLARYSVEAMEAAISAAYVIQIFQAPCTALAMMAQVYVGRHYGAQEYSKIGPGTWQFIWFSILSMALTVPASLIYGDSYFAGSVIKDTVMPYYYVLVSINFLYPLSTALSCYYLGQGKTYLVLFSTIGSQLLKLIFACLFIFGIEGLFSPLGLMGGAYSTVLAQGGFCILMMMCFINSKHAEMLRNREWQFNLSLFWQAINPGILRAFNRILTFTCWAAIAYLMSSRGEDYLLVLSIGGTLFLFLPFVADTICQTEITLVSHILGARNFQSLDKAYRSGMIIVAVFIALFSIPFVLFPTLTYSLLFPETDLSETMIRSIFLGVWLSFACFTVGFIPIGYVLAYKDTKFSLFMGGMNWLNGFALMYLAINVLQVSAEYFWIVLSLMHGSTWLLYYMRMQWLNRQAEQQPSQALS